MNKSRAVLRVLIQGGLMCLAVALMMASLGCTTAPPSKPQVIVPCGDPPELEVGPGLNSAQLEAALFAAYLDLRAQYEACQRQQVRP
jgi:hypothetical protein